MTLFHKSVKNLCLQLIEVATNTDCESFYLLTNNHNTDTCKHLSQSFISLAKYFC